ncbi:MAG TPA: FtsX-like permease family protein, partial [Micromonosporaceae bacterium]|nr:FtsX-like permease family protein [Micromonosporaceae bacterium]
MLGVTISALAARRTQALTVLLLALLAVAAATAAPWYAAARAESVGVADLAAANVNQRLIEVNQPVPAGQAGTVSPDRLRADVRDVLDTRAFDGVSGASGAGFAPDLDETAGSGGDGGGAADGADAIWLAYREGLCDQVVMIQGRCEITPGTMIIGMRQASTQALRVGSAVRIVSSSLSTRSLTLRVAGIYRPVDPTHAYWGDGELIGHAANSVRQVEASFTAYEAVIGFNPTNVELTYDLVVRPEALRGADLAALREHIRLGGYDLQRGPQRIQSQLPGLLERVLRDQELVRLGVTAGAGLLLILCWFALFLSVQATAQDRRPDLGWLRLHGMTRWRTWQLGFGQTALPLLGGGLLGAALGFAVARWYGGDVTDPATARSAALLAAGAAAVAVLGALVAAVVAQWRLMRATVVDLHRRVPPRRRGWRSDVLDLSVVLLAAAAVYQLGVDDRPAGLALFAQALAALAISLVLAWAVVPLAGRLAVRALRAGRLGTALVGTDLARRPAVHRIFALVCVAVALLGTAVLAWDADGRARAQRAEFQLGAARVLTVGADS